MPRTIWRYGHGRVPDVPDLATWVQHTPVLVDDIVSSARTLIETCRRITESGLLPPVCVAVHAIFAEDSYPLLKQFAARVATTDTIAHESNAIEVAGLLGTEVAALAAEPSRHREHGGA